MRAYVIFALLLLMSPAVAARDNLIRNGDFDDCTGWKMPGVSRIESGECITRLTIEPYTKTWSDLCRQVVAVKPHTDYVLTADGRIDQYPLSYGIVIGARAVGGGVIKDRLFLMARDNFTEMKMVFNSGPNSKVVIFAGVRADKSMVLKVDNFSLIEQQ